MGKCRLCFTYFSGKKNACQTDSIWTWYRSLLLALFLPFGICSISFLSKLSAVWSCYQVCSYLWWLCSGFSQYKRLRSGLRTASSGASWSHVVCPRQHKLALLPEDRVNNQTPSPSLCSQQLQPTELSSQHITPSELQTNQIFSLRKQKIYSSWTHCTILPHTPHWSPQLFHRFHRTIMIKRQQ